MAFDEYWHAGLDSTLKLINPQRPMASGRLFHAGDTLMTRRQPMCGSLVVPEFHYNVN